MPRKSSGSRPSLLKQSADSILSTWEAIIGVGDLIVKVDLTESLPVDVDVIVPCEDDRTAC
jgi:hypothetical protein